MGGESPHISRPGRGALEVGGPKLRLAISHLGGQFVTEIGESRGGEAQLEGERRGRQCVCVAGGGTLADVEAALWLSGLTSERGGPRFLHHDVDALWT